MTEDFVSKRLSQLRQQKKVSARDMSLSLGQNEGYINQIENGKALPSLTVLSYICDYFGINEKEFFDTELPYPAQTRSIIEDLQKLNQDDLTHIAAIVKALISKHT